MWPSVWGLTFSDSASSPALFPCGTKISHTHTHHHTKGGDQEVHRFRHLLQSTFSHILYVDFFHHHQHIGNRQDSDTWQRGRA